MRTNTTMKLTAMAAAIGFVMSSGAFAADFATQLVSYEVEEVAAIAVSGPPAAMTIAAAVAGQAPTAVTDTSTSYAISTNGPSKKITAAIDSDMPSGVTLAVALAAPTGGTSPGSLALSTGAVDVVTGITPVSEGTLGISYTLSATPAAGVVTGSRTVTFTILSTT